jgi:SEC-C motif-containing protein
MASDANKPCPCASGESYRACCQRYHRGEEPPDASALVRSRFAAFALGEGAYLWRTLHPAHALRARPQAEVERELAQARRTLRYRALVLHDAEVRGESARVLFTARVFEAGRDRSFLEASRFERTREGWRYLDGELWPAGARSERTLEALDALDADA